MNDQITADELVLGDVLVFCSSDLVSWAIRKLDNAEVSHAGLYIGGGQVAEVSFMPGLHIQPLTASLSGYDWLRARRLASTTDLGPVSTRSKFYTDQGSRYAYEQIILLAGICLTKRFDRLNARIRAIAYLALRKATEFLQTLGDKREPLICSEFVSRVFDEAIEQEGDAYTLDIRWPDDSSRTVLRLRRHRKISGETAEHEQTAIEPDSLLADLRRRPKTLQMRGTSISVEATSEEELKAHIAAWQAEGSTTRATALATPRQVSDEELLGAAADFAITYADHLQHVEADGEMRSVRGKALSAASPTERAMAAMTDFVTPGDLDRTVSLTTVGRLDK